MVSVVIVCRNAARTIQRAVQSALHLSEDVVVIDTGSTDGTLALLEHYPVRLYQEAWQGYGATKNRGNQLAKHTWVLSMDADEELSEELIVAIRQADLQDETVTFNMQRLSYLGQKPIYYGEWGRSYIIRLFNRNNAWWDASEVHEELMYKNKPKLLRLAGVLHHYTSSEIESFRQKLDHYASLMADKYLAKGKQASSFKTFLSPMVSFTRQYVLKAGFLDGKEGWQIAKANAWYTFQKYKLLHDRHKQQKRGK